MSILKGIEDIRDCLYSDQLEANLYGFLSYGFLTIGAFSKIQVPASGHYGGDYSRLRPAEDKYLTKGQAWEGFRQDWVWETGIPYDVQPNRPSGVTVNGVFQPATGVGPLQYTVDYPRGRVVFNSAISATGLVKCNYTFRLFHVHSASTPWWKQIQERSYRVDDPHFLQYGSGSWSVGADQRIQLPAIVIEVLPDSTRTPYEIGTDTNIVRQLVDLHILSETANDRGKLHDILTAQEDKRIIAFDRGVASRANRLPLLDDGQVNPSGYDFLALQGAFPWKQLRVVDTRGVARGMLGAAYFSTVRWTVEADLP